MIHRSRRLGVAVLTIGCMCLVAACGSSSKSGSGSSAANPAGHFAGFKLTSTQRSCLKQKGVTIPTAGFRGGAGAHGNFKGGPPNGKSAKGKFPKGNLRKGKFPKNGTPPAGFARQNSKRQAAFKACGVSFPSRAAGGASPSTTNG
jgi:hypothetical protein